MTGEAGAVHATSPALFETAAQHATRRVPIARPADAAGMLRAALAGERFDSAAHVAVCDDAGRFLGLLRSEDLLAAPAATTAGELMDRGAPVVAPGIDQEVAAFRAAERGESALAVVDAAGRFSGLIPPHRLIAVLLAEHEEDLSRRAGFLLSADALRTSSEEPVQKRIRHRLPWLLLGLGGALAAADLVAGFEATLNARVALVFFLPGIVYLADAVGTQTETVVVRALSLGVPLRRMALRELLTGAAIGVALAAVAFPLLWVRWGEFELACAVALAMLAACSTATLAAMTLPWLLNRGGFDPAFGSGPLATVLQDLLSILLFFLIAGTLVR
jgi:magnesium transporter